MSGMVLQAQRARAEAEAEANVRADQLAAERRLRERIEAVGEEQRILVRVVCHELRPPISSLEALCSALVDGASAASRMEATELIREHARHMSQMLAGVQQVVQASGPVPSVRRSAASVRRIAEHATAICGLSDREVVIYDRLPDTLSNVDVEKLTRVLVNLIDNAQRHNSPPG
jgi:K+-sensing histidine kinase KdpD